MIKLNSRQKEVLPTFPKFDDFRMAQLRKAPEYLRANVSKQINKPSLIKGAAYLSKQY